MEQYQKYKISLPATSLMTAYSYALSHYSRTNLKEPKLLGILLHRAIPRIRQPYACWLGWLSHYSMGAGWAIVASWLLRTGILKPSFRSALIMGIGSGIISVLAWRSLFRLHNRPPHIRSQLFYRQLITAHIIYMISFMTYYRKISVNDKTDKM